MLKNNWMDYFNRLPQAANDYLMSDNSGYQEEIAQDNLAYDNDAWRRVMGIVWELLFEKTSKEEFQAKVKNIAGDRDVQEVESELLLRLVYPLADLIPWDVEGRLQELGIQQGELQAVKRVSIMPLSYSAAARRIATNAKISVFQEALVKRLRDLIASVIGGLRKKDQVIEFLTRKQSDGGLGFSPEQAEQYTKELYALLETSTLLSEQEYSEWYRTARLSDEVMWKQDTADEDNENEDSDVPKVTSATLRTNKQYEPVLQSAIIECLQQIGDLSLDEYLSKRLENVISTRLRNVRNDIQTLDVLTRDSKIGGISLSKEEADRILHIIEASYELHHSDIENAQKKRIQDTEIAQKQKIEERKIQESEAHADWYQEKVAKPAFQNPMTTGNDTTMRQTPSNTAVRPNMSGITAPAMQLSDLIGEFKTLDIQEFRRLSSDPEQAGDKLFQKFETLRAESFDRYTAGIAAWRSSPLQKRYLQLVSESFSEGKTVAEVAEKHLAQDPNTPTAAELGAIITLNAKIQY